MQALWLVVDETHTRVDCSGPRDTAIKTSTTTRSSVDGDGDDGGDDARGLEEGEERS